LLPEYHNRRRKESMSLESVFKLSLIMNMIDHITGPMASVTSGIDNSVSRLEGMNQTLGNLTKTGATMAGVGAQITAAALSPVGATFETKRALGELKSVGVQDLKTLEKASSDFSNTWAGTTKAKFIGAAYDIKSGIASLSDEAVAKYTEIAGITAKGTKAAIGEMTSLFATGYGIYKGFYKDMSDIDFGEMFAAGIGHAANIFKTDGPEMARSISTLGAAATSAKVPMEEQFAILGMLQATMSGSEAGTKYRAFLQSAARAGGELGLKFTDANNQLLSMPEILDKLRGKFGDTMDAAEKMQIQKAFGTDEAVAMVDLLYSKTGDLQNGILSIYDSMGKGIIEVKEMANAINDTEPDQYEVLQQRIHNITESMGSSLLPTVNNFLEKSEQAITKVGEWVEKNQQLTRIILLVALAIGGFLTVAGTTIAVTAAAGLIINKTVGFIRGFIGITKNLNSTLDTMRLYGMYAGDGIRKGFSVIKAAGIGAITSIRSVAISTASMAKTAAVSGVTALKNMAVGLAGMARQAIVTAVTAMPGLIASVWAFTAALLANPITWIIIGIVALIAAIILLWQNWDSVVAWIRGAWSNFVNGIKAGFDWIRNLFTGMPLWLQIAIAAFMPFIGIPLLIITHWGEIVAFFANLWVRIKEGFVNGINSIKEFFLGIPGFFRESGAKIIDTLVEGIKSAAMKPVEAVKGIFQKVRDLLPFSDAKEGPLSTLTLSGQRTMTTFAEGVSLAQDAPAEEVEKSLNRTKTVLERKPVKKVSLKETAETEEQSATNRATETKDGVYIAKLLLNIDFSKIKELPQLIKLLKEIENYTNANGGEVDLTAAPEPI
jgi:hypothetical protein